jgi:hypothetical protein
MKKLEKLFGMNMSESVTIDMNSDSEYIDFIELSKQEALKRNSNIIECPKCHVKGNEPNMYRWHFDNCSTKFRLCEQCNKQIPRQGIKPFLYDVKKFCNRKCYMESKKGIAPIVMTDELKNKLSKIALSQSKERSDRMKKTQPWKVKLKK